MKEQINFMSLMTRYNFPFHKDILILSHKGKAQSPNPHCVHPWVMSTAPTSGRKHCLTPILYLIHYSETSSHFPFPEEKRDSILNRFVALKNSFIKLQVLVHCECFAYQLQFLLIGYPKKAFPPAANLCGPKRLCEAATAEYTGIKGKLSWSPQAAPHT